MTQRWKLGSMRELVELSITSTDLVYILPPNSFKFELKQAIRDFSSTYPTDTIVEKTRGDKERERD